MVQGDIADSENNFQCLGSSRLPIAHGGQDEGPKKTPETDAIFDNVWQVNALADVDPEALRISMDTKATVHVGEYSRGGQSRGLEPVKALDHDMHPKEKLVPGGILEPVTGRAFLFYTGSNKTSDFLGDGLLLWWNERQRDLSDVKRVVINVDNGPECSGHRSQFLLRMVQFADMTQLTVRIIYYPPYHSKYNAIERYWGGLEKSWNGYLLHSVNAVLNRSANFLWKGVRATVRLLDAVYEKGIKLCKKENKELEQRLQRSPELPWYDITIKPKMVY
jgi:hypothetical protein